jgi:hypothetical protein
MWINPPSEASERDENRIGKPNTRTGDPGNTVRGPSEDPPIASEATKLTSSRRRPLTVEASELTLGLTLP